MLADAIIGSGLGIGIGIGIGRQVALASVCTRALSGTHPNGNWAVRQIDTDTDTEMLRRGNAKIKPDSRLRTAAKIYSNVSCQC